MRLFLDTCSHERGVASPEDFIAGIIRVLSDNSWFKYPFPANATKEGSLAEYGALIQKNCK
jgi:hypothetical protein